MNWKKKKKFPISTIMFDQTYVKDNDGNILFKLNNYINQKQFGCDVGILYSENEELPHSSKNKIIILIIVIVALHCTIGVIGTIIKKCKRKESGTDIPTKDSSSIKSIKYIENLISFSSK